MSLPSSEQWRPVPGYEAIYEVSDQGRVRSLDRSVATKGGAQRRIRGRVLAGIPHYADRLAGQHCIFVAVNLKRNGTSKTVSIHRLVMAAFVGPLPAGGEVCHDNGDAKDNRLVNLSYGTASQNARDRVRHGDHNHARKTHCPNNHLLAEPNLVASQARRGHRSCLACDRSRAYARFAQRTGSSYDFVAGSHEYYSRIMASA